MTRQNLEHAVTNLPESFDNISATVFTYAPCGPRSGPSFRKIPTDQPLSSDLARRLAHDLMQKYSNASDDAQGIAEFDFEERPSHQIAFTRVDEDPNISRWFYDIPPLLDLPSFSGDTPYMKKTKYYGVKILFEECGDPYWFFRRKSPGASFSRRRLLGVFDGNRYTKTSQKVLTFEDNADLLIYRGIAYIFSLDAFQSISDSSQQIKISAETHFDTAISEISLNDHDNLRTKIINDGRFAKKLLNAKRANPNASLDASRVEQIINDYGLKINCEQSENGPRLIINPEDNSQIWDFLGLSQTTTSDLKIQTSDGSVCQK